MESNKIDGSDGREHPDGVRREIETALSGGGVNVPC